MPFVVVRRSTLTELRAAKNDLQQHHEDAVSCAEALDRSRRVASKLINLREQDRRWYQDQVRALSAKATAEARKREAANPSTEWDRGETEDPDERLRIAVERAAGLGRRLCELQAANESTTTELRDLRRIVAEQITAGRRHDNPAVRAFAEQLVGELDVLADDTAQAVAGGAA